MCVRASLGQAAPQPRPPGGMCVCVCVCVCVGVGECDVGLLFTLGCAHNRVCASVCVFVLGCAMCACVQCAPPSCSTASATD